MLASTTLLLSTKRSAGEREAGAGFGAALVGFGAVRPRVSRSHWR
jgi:hypothetical protein